MTHTEKTESAATTRSDDLTARLETVNDEFVATIEACTDAQWRLPCVDEGRTVGVVAHHIATVQRDFAKILGILAGGGSFSPKISMEQVHESNATHARDHADVSAEETLAEFRASRAALGQRFRAIGERDLDRVAGVFGGNELTIAQVMEWVIIGHAAAHLANIRATLSN